MLFMFHFTTWAYYGQPVGRRPSKLCGCSCWGSDRLQPPVPSQFNHCLQADEWHRHWSQKPGQEHNSRFLHQPRTCVFAFICGLQLEDKGEIFKSRNENQGPRSHWLVMKAGGRRPRCASQTSMLCPRLSWDAEGGDIPVVPPTPLRHQKSSGAAAGDLSLRWNCFTGAGSELLLGCVVQRIPPGTTVRGSSGFLKPCCCSSTRAKLHLGTCKRCRTGLLRAASGMSLKYILQLCLQERLFNSFKILHSISGWYGYGS